MVSISLDDCMEDHRLARQLRAAGHLVYLPSELGVTGQSDESHLAAATDLSAVVVTHNQKHFTPLHHSWENEGRGHAGILLVIQNLDIGTKLASIDRAARLLTPEAAKVAILPFKYLGSSRRAPFLTSACDRIWAADDGT